MSRDHRERDFVLGALIGGTLGALTAMMFTTKKGQELQDDALAKYQDFQDTVRCFADSKKRKIKSEFNKIMNAADNQVEKSSKKVRKQVKKVKKRVNKKLEK